MSNTGSEDQLVGQIRHLVDRQAILDCIVRCARGVDRLDRDLIVSAYHADGIDDHGKFIGGPQEFADWVIDMHRTTHLTHQHCVFNHSCDVDGDVAHAETYYMFTAINATGATMAISGGRYLDRLERRVGRWAIAFRLCVRDWAPVDQQPDMTDASAFTNTRASLPPDVRAFMRTGATPRRDRSDPSYDRPLILDPNRLDAWRRLRS